MKSCIYRGHIRHRRFGSVSHIFTYPLFMVYLDLAELDSIFRGRLFWSTKGLNLAWFRRADHFGDPDSRLDTCVRNTVERETGERPDGPIRLLTHLRYFGYVVNPVSFYFCFDKSDKKVTHTVLEVTNTPWKERHIYVLTNAGGKNGKFGTRFDKEFHVSPFLPLDMMYQLSMSGPEERLALHIENHRKGNKAFDATLTMKRSPINGVSLAKSLAFYPFMTLQVIGAIYLEAMRLWWKGTRFYPHPNGAPAEQRTQSHESGNHSINET